ncbi:MAG TPA: HAMP domain-containing protein [candidate division Zixibacteria bacterium]|nr:HAMP domain-containing protein [candidate division Zixibacteria bacterium]
MEQDARRVGLKWKVGGIFTGVMLMLTLVVAAGVYRVTQNLMQEQLDKRAFAMATNLSDAAAGYLAGQNVLALHALVRKYTLFDGVAYAVIRNGKGEIVAHTFGAVPPEIVEAPTEARRGVARRRLSLQGSAVYETSVPVLDGQAGTVHVGFWRGAIEQEIWNAVLSLIGVVSVLPVLGALLSFFLAHWIVRPIVGLTQIADKVTMGDLETAISGKCVALRDEIGDLARSLERMRSSLKAAMLRLGRETA